MPCSLLSSPNDSYSDISYTSGRSLDSKNGPKKVSFNKAVRVKQYPWKPDLERQTVEHITLPSNRFWFKVYKNKPDSTYGSHTGVPLYINAWDEDVTDNTPDSLAPIAEVEDQEVDSNNFHKKMKETSNNEYQAIGQSIGPSNSYTSSYHPFEPPIDYFDKTNGNSIYKYGSGKQLGRRGERNDFMNNNYGSNQLSPSRPFISNGFGNYQNIPEESEIMDQYGSSSTEFVPPLLQLPRMSLRSDSTRQSARRLDTSRGPRERRSRSHDDHVQQDCQFKHLRRADKSVSTEDLSINSMSCPNNGFLKTSRDMATQCYRTLDNDSQPSFNINDVSRKQQNYQSSNSELIRLNNFKNAETKSNENRSTLNSHQIKKQDNQSSFDKNNYQTRNTISSVNSNYNRINSQSNGKLNNKARILSGNENTLLDQNYRGPSNRILISRSDIPSSSSSYTNGRKPIDNHHLKLQRDSATVGYLKGRQIPLSEVNSNANGKSTSKNERASLFTRRFENLPSNNKGAKPEVYSAYSPTQHPRKYPNLKNTRPKVELPYPDKSRDFSSRENNMIDWSLSGFQLATKPDTGITSMSDSEYTVHRRPPLLMYIPGVSHQDRPAVDDGHLSVLSDLSEGSDGMSLLTRDVSKRKSVTSDMRRRTSSPRNGKFKWLK